LIRYGCSTEIEKIHKKTKKRKNTLNEKGKLALRQAQIEHFRSSV